MMKKKQMRETKLQTTEILSEAPEEPAQISLLSPVHDECVVNGEVEAGGGLPAPPLEQLHTAQSDTIKR